MIAKRLCPGDTVGIAAPSWLATAESYAPAFEAIRARGLRVKAGSNLYAHGWGYAASDEERAADLNQLIADDEVKLVLFGGGEGAEDVLPLIDWQAVRRHPKLYLSYSDGTSILDAIWSRTGLVTYYGQTPQALVEASAYNALEFTAWMLDGGVREHVPASEWRTLTGGTGAGTLVGGYLGNFLHLCGSGWLRPAPGEDYLLMIEDHERFSGIEAVSAQIGRLERLDFMKQVRGLVFGHYSAPVNEQLLARLRLLGERRGIPVVYCDDFGHGANRAILPIGARAELNADCQRLIYV